MCTFPLTFPPVLAAAVTQASLRSVLHKLLAAGPAFNITALLSAAQHSNQGTSCSFPRFLCVFYDTTLASTCSFFLAALVIAKRGKGKPVGRSLTLSPYFSPALQSVARLSDVGRIIAAAVCLAAQRYAAEQPEIDAPRRRGVRSNKGEQAEAL